MSPETNYLWVEKPIYMEDEETDLPYPETEWSKIVKVNEKEWLFFMGARFMENGINQIGTKPLLKLNIESGRLIEIS